jgi:UDP-4-amino-4,6-dideoxy-N-acetyl-beta-L-altrosamine transaminase
MIPYGRQHISQEDIEAVVAVLKSDYLTQGQVVPEFEKTVADYCGVDHAVAVNSATAALHIACLALGVGKGDIVWTSPITFVASANCALYCGATLDFVDIDARTYNMSVGCLEVKLIDAEKTGKLPKVVIPVHLCGQSCEMERIYKLSLKFGFKIIEDASHAIGGQYKGELIGNCKYSDITVFSFHPVKIITTGEGGMALTRDADLSRRMRLRRSHGISNAKIDWQPRSANELWNYQQIELGFNYRMTDIQAALGISQMRRLNDFVAKRHIIAKRYDHELKEMDLQTPWQHEDTKSAYHLYPILITKNINNAFQKHVYSALHAEGISVNLHYIPVYRHPFYEAMGFQSGYCPKSEIYYQQTLSLPIFPKLTYEEQTKVIQALSVALK